MRYVKQFAIIILFSFMGELLKEFLPFLIPASIYGLVLLLIALLLGIVKLPDVKEAGDFLLDVMPVMFIPASVGLMDSWGVLRSIMAPAIIATVVGTVIVMAVSGIVTEGVLRLFNRHKADASYDTEEGSDEDA